MIAFLFLSPEQRATCSQTAVFGPCKARIPRFWYNPLSGKCELFFYGGCRGNDNNFLNVKECEGFCKSDCQPKRVRCLSRRAVKKGVTCASKGMSYCPCSVRERYREAMGKERTKCRSDVCCCRTPKPRTGKFVQCDNLLRDRV